MQDDKKPPVDPNIPKTSEVGKKVSESFKGAQDEEAERIKQLLVTPVKEYLNKLRGIKK
jgi:hypothetical protein